MTMTNAASDRRHEPRVQALDLVHIEEYRYPALTSFKTDDAVGRTLDLSHDGMRLQLDHPLLLKTKVRLDLALGNTVLRVEGRVVSSRIVEDRYEMGIEFTGVKPEQWEAIDAYLHLRAD
jgi:hypothetical protein